MVESRRYAGNKVAHRHVLYLGEINDSQRAAWERTIAVIDEREGAVRQLALFPADRTPPPSAVDTLQVRLSELSLAHPRQWGACWLGDQLWRTLPLDDFFGARLPVSREDTDWEKVLRILVIYRLLSPGSEWRLHRHWFGPTALADLLGADARAVQDDTLYRCHDLILPLKEDLFGHLRQRWSDLFGAFLAYCLVTTLRQQLRGHAAGLMPRVVFEKLATLQMLDVCVPTTDGRELLLVRHTEPSTDVALLLKHLKLTLPPQPPPKIRYPANKPSVWSRPFEKRNDGSTSCIVPRPQ